MEVLPIYAGLAAAGDPVEESYPGIGARLRAVRSVRGGL